MLVHGRGDLAEIPDDAPTYLTRLTRQAVASLPLLDRVLPEARLFSDRSAREIPEFVVRSNLTVLHGRTREHSSATG